MFSVTVHNNKKCVCVHSTKNCLRYTYSRRSSRRRTTSSQNPQGKCPSYCTVRRVACVYMTTGYALGEESPNHPEQSQLLLYHASCWLLLFREVWKADMKKLLRIYVAQVTPQAHSPALPGPIQAHSTMIREIHQRKGNFCESEKNGTKKYDKKYYERILFYNMYL